LSNCSVNVRKTLSTSENDVVGSYLTYDNTLWECHTIDEDASGREPDGARLADFDKDGLSDVVSGFEEGGQVKIYLNPGENDVKSEWPSIIVGTAYDAEDAFGTDIDKDGFQDIIVSSEGEEQCIAVFWSPSNIEEIKDPSKWTKMVIPASTGLKWMYSIPWDINQDGYTDIVSGGKKGEIGWFQVPSLDPRDPNQWTYTKIDDVNWTMSLLKHDVDGDGNSDLIVSDRYGTDSGAKWYKYPAWEKNYFDSTRDDEVMFLSKSDLNKNNKTDLVVPIQEKQISVIWGLQNPETLTISNKEHVKLGTIKGSKAGDIDLDGCNDIVLSFAQAYSSKQGVGWIKFDEWTGKWIWIPISGKKGEKFDQVVLKDVDLDGDLDVITTEEIAGLGVIWYENPTI
jgi:hypothetical protein